MRPIVRLSNTCRAAVLAGAVAVFASSPPVAALEIRAATEVASGGDLAILVEEFKKEVDERSGGDITVSTFTGGALGTQRQLQEQIVLGTIEVVATASDIVELSGAFSVFDLPFLFSDSAHAHRAMDGALGEALNETLIEDQGVRVIGFGELGFRHITNAVRPITSPGDLEGMKVRTPSNELRIAAFDALGAAPTPIAYSELYSALQQGVVDGQENPLTTIQEQSLWEVQDHVAMTYHVFTPGYLIVNNGWWQGLDDATRQMLSEAAAAAAGSQRAILAASVGDMRERAEENGMTFSEPDLGPFVEKTRGVWATFEEEHGKALIEAVDSVR